MVHALREARRVLRPGGLLLDLRPAAKHRRIGVGTDRRWKLVGVMRERFDEDHAADRAVAGAVREGWLGRGRRIEVRLDREMDTLEDFRSWLAEFAERRPLPGHEQLIRRTERAHRETGLTIVARGPLVLQVLRRTD